MDRPENINDYMNDLGKDSFLTFVKRYAAIIGGIVGLYFLYNFDIHIAMKIILTVLILLGEVGYYLYNELYLSIVGSEVLECLATEYYINNLNVLYEDNHIIVVVKTYPIVFINYIFVNFSILAFKTLAEDKCPPPVFRYNNIKFRFAIKNPS